MRKHLHVFVGLLVGLGLAFLLKENWFGFLIFGIAGFLGGEFSDYRPKGSEMFYWLALLAIVVMFALAFLRIVTVPGWMMFAPVVFVLAYFIARFFARPRTHY